MALLTSFKINSLVAKGLFIEVAIYRLYIYMGITVGLAAWLLEKLVIGSTANIIGVVDRAGTL